MTPRLALLASVLFVCACSSSGSGGADGAARPTCSEHWHCTSGVCAEGQCVADPADDVAAPLFDAGDADVADASPEGIVPDDAGGDLDAADGQDLAPPPCTAPLDWVCTSASVRSKCDAGAIVSEPCGAQETCISGACIPQICSPGTTACVGADTFHKCDGTGTAWAEEQVCPAGPDIQAVCDPDTHKCGCQVPVHVLFVLDASGSMQLEEVSTGVSQWDVALDAIEQIMLQYPFLTYGLATFPDQTVDCGTDHCEGWGGCAYTQSVNLDLATGQVDAINDYLASRALSADPANLMYVLTPLLGILNYLTQQYPESGPLKDHKYPAYLVLLSDGQDSCENPLNPAAATAPIAAQVALLLEQYLVKTFAIGFNLADGFEQLDAIAMHGGTGLAAHVSAADLDSLLAAFNAIFETMEIRKCDTWPDDVQPPDCDDADADGWCQALDCDDADPLISLGAAEQANNDVDDDCDGQTDERPDEELDQDEDGYTPAQGDCKDFAPTVNPDAIEEPDDGVDNDCDGQTDEAGCDCTPATGASLEAMACAAEIACVAGVVQAQGLSSPSGDDLDGAWTAVSHFGSSGNDLAPKVGPSYALLASGPATGTSHSDDLSGGGSWNDPYSSSDACYDVAEWTVTLEAPMHAKGFSIDYVFFSEEYDDYVGTDYNDKIYILMQAPLTTQGQTKVINFTDCRDPGSYHDLSGADCPLASGFCCYIAINTALSECCWYDGCPDGTWTTDISGTGYSCASGPFFDGETSGSSTGWLTTSWPIEPGETFTLTFHVHDTSDGIYDSEVILDNFRWHSAPTMPGTEPAGD
jgi:hypothetical protein